jgi:hypothetical protein
MMIAPAARSLCTAGWSSSDGVPDVAAEPIRITSPWTGTLSLIAIGTPASGSFRRCSTEARTSASARAVSARTCWNAPRCGSTAAIRERCASTISRGVTCPARTRAARFAALSPTRCERTPAAMVVQPHLGL